MVIILVDMRENNGHVVEIDDENGIAEFGTLEAAQECMKNHPLNVFPILYVDIDNQEVIAG